MHAVLFIFLQDIPYTLGFFLVSPGGAVPLHSGSPRKTASSTCLSLAESCSLLTASSWADFRARTQHCYVGGFAVSWNWYSQGLEEKWKLSDRVMWKKRKKNKVASGLPYCLHTVRPCGNFRLSLLPEFFASNRRVQYQAILQVWLLHWNIKNIFFSLYFWPVRHETPCSEN